MNIIKSEINWNLGLGNLPDLVIHTDSNIPDFIYESKEISGGTLYFAEKDGFVSFLAENSKNRRGFAGRNFSLQMQSGEIRQVKGPWSSRPGVINNFFPHSVSCQIFKEGYTVYNKEGFYIAAVSLTTAQEAIKTIPNAELRFIDQNKNKIKYRQDKYYEFINSVAEFECTTCKGFGIDKKGNPCRFPLRHKPRMIK